MDRRAVFLDRDGTIIEDPGYINNPQQVKLLPHAAAALVELRKMGYKIIVVSNQSGIARGIITEQALAQIHERLKQLLAEQNAYLDRIYYCPYHPEGVIPKYRRDSDWRKPKPGMLLAAAKEMNIDLAESWLIGNEYRDIAAGKNAGCRTILIKSHINPPVKQLTDPEPDFYAVNLKEAVNILKRETMSRQIIEPKQQPQEPQPAPPPETIEQSQQPVVQNEVQIPLQEHSQVQDVEQAPEEQESFRPVEQKDSSDYQPQRIEQLLEDIKQLLKTRHRQELYSDFSVLKLFAGILQIVVLFCLLVALWYGLSPTAGETAAFIPIGFAIVLQLIVLTLYVMHNEK